MRGTVKPPPPAPPEPIKGSQRIVRRFLWRKMTLSGEWRWLEFAGIVQVYMGKGGLYPADGWVTIYFETPRTAQDVKEVNEYLAKKDSKQ